MQHSAFLQHIESWLEAFNWEKRGDLWLDPKNSDCLEPTAGAIAIQVRRSERTEAEEERTI